jgi:hypothetical protein
MSASGSAISTAERIAAWAREERMRITGRVPSDPRKAKAISTQADVLLKMEGYAHKIKSHLEREERISSIAWQRARIKSNMLDRAIRMVRGDRR